MVLDVHTSELRGLNIPISIQQIGLCQQAQTMVEFPKTLNKSIVQTFLSKPVHSSTYGMALSCNEAQRMFNWEIDTWLWHGAKHCRGNVQLLWLTMEEVQLRNRLRCFLVSAPCYDLHGSENHSFRNMCMAPSRDASVVSSTWFVSPYHYYCL